MFALVALLLAASIVAGQLAVGIVTPFKVLQPLRLEKRQKYCPAGQVFCTADRCMPAGAQCCDAENYCDAGTHCIVNGCCPNGLICSDESVDVDYTLSTSTRSRTTTSSSTTTTTQSANESGRPFTPVSSPRIVRVSSTVSRSEVDLYHEVAYVGLWTEVAGCGESTTRRTAKAGAKMTVEFDASVVGYSIAAHVFLGVISVQTGTVVENITDTDTLYSDVFTCSTVSSHMFRGAGRSVTLEFSGKAFALSIDEDIRWATVSQIFAYSDAQMIPETTNTVWSYGPVRTSSLAVSAIGSSMGVYRPYGTSSTSSALRWLPTDLEDEGARGIMSATGRASTAATELLVVAFLIGLMAI